MTAATAFRIDLLVVDHIELADLLGRVAGDPLADGTMPPRAVTTRDSMARDLRPGDAVALLDGAAAAADAAWRAGASAVYALTTPGEYRDALDYLTAGQPPNMDPEARALWAMARRWPDLVHGRRSIDRPAGPRGLVLTPLAEMVAMPPPEWRVGGLLPVQGLAVLAAEPGTGKTLLALDLSLRAAHGLDWLGRIVRPCASIYLTGEGWGGLGARCAAWVAAHSSARQVHPVYFSALPALTSTAGLAAVDAALVQHRPGIVAIDTLSLAGLTDENDAVAVGALLRDLGALAHRHCCLVLLLHHLSKDAARAPVARVRGSGALVGGVDTVLLLRRDGDAIVLSVAKQRDGEAGADVRLAIQPIELPAGGRSVFLAPAAPARMGEPDAAVLDALRAAGPEGATRAQVRSAAGLAESTTWDALRRLVADGRVRDAEDGPRGRRRYWLADLPPTIRTTPPDGPGWSDDGATARPSGGATPYGGGWPARTVTQPLDHPAGCSGAGGTP